MYTYVRNISFTYPAGAQALHANFHGDDTGFYFASGDTIYAYNTDGTRAAARDITTLENHPSTETIWGFTKANDLWYIMTRETSSTDSRQIGLIRVFNEQGRSQRVFSVPNNITGVNTVATPWRAQKGLAVIGNKIYTRVVQHQNAPMNLNMRLIAFELPSGNALSENNMSALQELDRLSDMATNGYRYIIIVNHRNTGPLYEVAYTMDTENNFVTVPELRTDLRYAADPQNRNPFGASAHEGTLWIADRNAQQIHEYSGVPERGAAGTGDATGYGLSIVNIIVLAARLEQNLRNRPRDRR